MYVSRPPFFLPWYYPDFTWRKATDEKLVYLTFDDGPIPDVTSFVLNTLKKFQIPATFFCIGDNIEKHPELFQQILAEGHQVGNHTFNHLKGWDTADERYVQNFWQCQQHTQSHLFRPPYGRIKKSQAKSIRQSWQEQNPHAAALEIVMWDVLTGDFDTSLSGEACYQNVVNNVRNGSIIVFHDSVKAWDRLSVALPKAIEYLLAKGYQFALL
jgi:peptidoglycan/xylan/chitin deacetylase (PgdA/CDA1 family)